MKSRTNNILKIDLLFVIIIFLFTKVKAESYDSAFSSMSFVFFQKDFISNQSEGLEQKYNKAKKLFENENYSEALKITYSLLRIENDEMNIKANYLLGKIFEEVKNLDLTIKYFREALRLIDKNIKWDVENSFESESKVIEAEILLLLGKTYIDKHKENKKLDSTFYFLNRLTKIESFEEKILSFKARGYNNLSIAEYLRKNYSKAKEHSFKAIGILEKLEKEYFSSATYINLANIYETTGKREKALETYLKVLPYFEHKNDPKSLEYKEILYYNIAWTMFNLKDYKAYNYLEKSYDLKDSLIDISLKQELKKIEQTHNIDLIRKEEENKRFQLERNNWFIGITGVSLSLLFLYIANLYKLKQKNLSLQLSQKELEQQKKLEKLRSETQSKIINAAMDAKEDERQLIAETLHDSVSAMLSSANMHLEASLKYFEGEPPIEFQKTKDIITETSQKIRDLSHTLVSSFLLKFGLEYAIKDKAEKYSNSNIRIHTAIANVDRYAQDFEVKIFNIVQELINNVLKHSNASSAFIAIEEEEDTLLIIVKDNGIGFQKKRKELQGVGLSQIEARVEGMNGDFIVETSKERGTKITIEVPVVKKRSIIHV